MDLNQLSENQKTILKQVRSLEYMEYTLLFWMSISSL